MINMEEFVRIQLGEQSPPDKTTPVSFRCSPEIIIKLDALAEVLNFSTRSKLLSNLVPIAIDEAVGNLPDHLHNLYMHQVEEALHTERIIDQAEGN